MSWNLSGSAAVVLAAGLLVLSPVAARHAPDSPATTSDRAGPAPADTTGPVDTAGPATRPQTGAIEGVLEIRPRPPRRTVNRYGVAPRVAEVQEIPPVVFIAGRAGSAPAPGPDVVMAQQDTAFSPPLLVVPAGTTVEFPNQDPFFHNVFSYSSSARFDLGRYPLGESKSVTFDEPGIVKVYCEVHESMRSAVVVTENRYWARPDADGTFRLEGVPAGTHTLVAWHADRRETEREVEVPAGGVARVELEL